MYRHLGTVTLKLASAHTNRIQMISLIGYAVMVPVMTLMLGQHLIILLAGVNIECRKKLLEFL